MDKEVRNAQLLHHHSVASAFRPLCAWALCSLLLLAWDWHERHLAATVLTFRVTVDRASSFPDQVTAELNGRPFYPGQNMGLGRSRLVLKGQNLEPFATNLFGWYGRNDLGVLPLVRSKGTLEIRCEPVPREIEVAGQVVQTKREGAPRLYARIPVGDYAVTATFLHWVERRTVRVARNETNRVDIAPALGAVALLSDPPGVRFELQGGGLGGLDVNGATPAEVDQAPAGEYDLFLQWNGASKRERLQIKAGETNREEIVFPYGTVQLATAPSGASVSSGFSDTGKTPLTLLLQPGQYQFRMSLKGYRSTDVNVRVEDHKTVTISTNLVNATYADAMDAARNEVNMGRYEEALSRVNEALKIAPNDFEAMGLKTEITGSIADREAKAEADKKAAAAQAAERARQGEEERKKAAYEARKREVAAAFEKAVGQTTDAGLFPSYIWRLTNRLDQVRTAVQSVLQERDAPWHLTEQSAPDNQSWLCWGEGRGGFLGTRRTKCGLMVAELSPGEVFLYAKFFEYVLGDKIGFTLSGVTPESFVPVAPGRYHPNEPGAAEAHMKAVAEDFRRRLVKQLQ
ncbi:MAG: PEGA domain-containing protein [Verrucomicrobia bacterium]|nr:PEGA domain-containing protein [Verrucomicrobiota bacterium]